MKSKKHFIYRENRLFKFISSVLCCIHRINCHTFFDIKIWTDFKLCIFEFVDNTRCYGACICLLKTKKHFIYTWWVVRNAPKSKVCMKNSLSINFRNFRVPENSNKPTVASRLWGTTVKHFLIFQNFESWKMHSL